MHTQEKCRSEGARIKSPTETALRCLNSHPIALVTEYSAIISKERKRAGTTKSGNKGNFGVTRLSVGETTGIVFHAC